MSIYLIVNNHPLIKQEHKEEQIIQEFVHDGAVTQVGSSPKLMMDTQHSTQTQHSMYLNGESWAWNVNPSTLKIPYSNTWSWVLSFKCGVLRNCHKFGVRPQTNDGYSALHTQNAIIFMYLNLEFWVWSVNPDWSSLIYRHKVGAWWLGYIMHFGCQNLYIPTPLSAWKDLESYSLEQAQDSPIQIHGVLRVECRVSVISLGPD